MVRKPTRRSVIRNVKREDKRVERWLNDSRLIVGMILVAAYLSIQLQFRPDLTLLIGAILCLLLATYLFYVVDSSNRQNPYRRSSVYTEYRGRVAVWERETSPVKRRLENGKEFLGAYLAIYTPTVIAFYLIS